MGASQTKPTHKNNRNSRKLRRHDYRMVSGGSRLYGNLEPFSSMEDADSYFSGLSASVLIPLQRDSSVHSNVESSTRPVAKVNGPTANQTPKDPQRRTMRINSTSTPGVQNSPKPVTRHHSAVFNKSLIKTASVGVKPDTQQLSKCSSTAVSQQCKSQSNAHISDVCRGGRMTDNGFHSSVYPPTDSLYMMDSKASDLTNRSATLLDQRENRKVIVKNQDDLLNFSQDLRTGDMQADDRPDSPSPKVMKSTRRELTSRLSDKPPTPPPKPNLVKSSNAAIQNSSLTVRSQYANSKTVSPTNMKQTYHSPSTKQKSLTIRSNSAPRSPTMKDCAIPKPLSYSVPSSPAKPKRSGSQISSSDADRREKPTCLSRIEYTFYINDTEAYQRPFYDRRVEAVARASQCNICLHKPPPGQKPIYYKGNRVLPVTISARTMVSLKRCMARLDIQYPYFNVKAFCPPDMY
ncbi:hypothetical protein FBUS_10385 [Fasciolopsis buskii]|uniref:Uncharacterized protein n=1 Tax=Fasciolopsis buskii TaxID=27845 RepID=A0A8E0RQE7_9TREM|nr:hypothetical protein FBUS_10385 [Fasciolopsis buski]